MEKKDLIKVENAAIRAAGSRMAKMFHPNFPQGVGTEVQKLREAERAFYEGFQEGAAYYRLLVSRINDEFANLIEGARLDSGTEEDTHSAMEMCLKNGIPVITAVQKAPGKKEAEKLHEAVKNYISTVPLDMSPEEAKKFAEEHTTESEPEEPSKDDSAVPEQRVVKKFDIPVPDTISDQQKMFAKKLEFPIEQAKAEPEKEAEEPKGETAQLDPEGYPLWKHPMDKIEKVLENFGVKFERQGDENILYLRFKKGDVEYTIYFEKHEDGNYKVVFSDRDEHGGKVLCDGVIADSLALMAFEHSLAKHITGW